MNARMIAAAILLTILGSTFARAQVINIPFGQNISVASGAPVTINVTHGAMTNVLGYSLNGNWTAGMGDPYSEEFQVSLGLNGVATSPLNFMGGLANGNSFAFPGNVPTNGATINSTLSGSLPSTAGGSGSITFDTFFSGSDVSLTNGSLDVFTNPTSLNGTTTGGPTFHQATLFGDALHPNATNVAYAVTKVNVSANGRYMLAESSQNHDGVFFLYTSFDPSNPTANFVNAGNNPNGPIRTEAFTAVLNSGVDYFLVSTGFGNSDAGDFTVFGSGPGSVTFNPVPEPATMLLSGLAMMTIGVWTRRQTR
jgi:hypothetical protein